MSSDLHLQIMVLISVAVFFARMILLIIEKIRGSDEFLEALAGSTIPAGLFAMGVVSWIFVISQLGG